MATTDENHSNCLVVLCNGLLGRRTDLTYISQKLQEKGYFVLQSQSNQLYNSLDGIAEGGRKLKNEILEAKSQNLQFTKIGFIGNSLGGLYVRYLLSLLFEKDTNTLVGLVPDFFMTIATPHLGVRHHTFIEDYNLPTPPLFLKYAISSLLLQSGKDLFGTDTTPFNQSLIYRMATENQFLDPLRAIPKLRLYVNLQLDIAVPLGTGGIFPAPVVTAIRQRHYTESGIVNIVPPFSSPVDTVSALESTESISDETEKLEYKTMIDSLNSLPWEKVLVKFEGLWIWPSAHRKIGALTKYGAVIDQILGYPEGQFVMDNAVEWILSENKNL